MGIRSAVGVGALAATLALSGCSSSKKAAAAPAQGTSPSASAPGGVPNGAMPGAPSATASSSAAPGSTAGGDSSAGGTTGSTGSTGSTGTSTAGKPVSALLAGIDGPVTTLNMPKAKPEWIAAVQTRDDTGKDVSAKAGMSLNLVALVDEAAKTSDMPALIKMCNLCDQQALKQKLTAVDGKGLTGFQELSRILEKTHPAPSHTVAPGWDFPGFTSPEKGGATALDQQDMALLGATYTGIRAQFANLGAGSKPFDGWTGTGAPGT
jgi:hypothetical protein